MKKEVSQNEFRKYYLSEFELYDGETFIPFNIVLYRHFIILFLNKEKPCQAVFRQRNVLLNTGHLFKKIFHLIFLIIFINNLK